MSAIETRHFKALQINFPEVCLFYIKYNEKEFAFFLIYFFAYLSSLDVLDHQTKAEIIGKNEHDLLMNRISIQVFDCQDRLSGTEPQL